MDFLAPFNIRDPGYGLCALPESSQRGEALSQDFTNKHMRPGAAPAMSLSPDHKLCALAGGYAISVFNTDTLSRLMEYRKSSHSYTVTDVVWSPHGLLKMLCFSFCLIVKVIADVEQ